MTPRSISSAVVLCMIACRLGSLGCVQSFSISRLTPTPTADLSLMAAGKDEDDGLGLQDQAIYPTTSTQTTPSRKMTTTSRRNWFRRIVTATIVASHFPPARPSWALKPRNEALCGTGLFTNYLEYRCTDLGDISDEGQKTSFSNSKDAGAADSLLGKLNLNLDPSDIENTSDSLMDQQIPRKTNNETNVEADTREFLKR